MLDMPLVRILQPLNGPETGFCPAGATIDLPLETASHLVRSGQADNVSGFELAPPADWELDPEAVETDPSDETEPSRPRRGRPPKAS